MDRRLTTIVAADIAGFSALIGRDEEGTLTALRAYRTDLIDPLIATHKGRIANTAGDSLLIEFPSAVEAVRCAIALQDGMAARNADIADDRRILYRIGINVGDVVDQDGDLLGDGVNIAARLEGLAPPGGIVLSQTVHDQIRDKLDLNLADLGDVQVKNIARPVRAHHLRREGEKLQVRTKRAGRRRLVPLAVICCAVLLAGVVAWTFIAPQSDTVEQASDTLPDKPAIAVLAFDNLSGDPNQEYLSDALSEDIIGALARIKDILVIARNSSFIYKGKPVKIQEVGRDLGVHYVLEGSIQRSDDRMRVTAQLIDAQTGLHVWARKYDRDVSDIFAVKDEITREIVTSMNAELVDGDMYWMRAPSIDNLEAWLVAVESVKPWETWTQEGTRQSIDLLNRALALDPDSPAIHAYLSWRHSRLARMRWDDDPDAMTRKAIDFAEKAISLGPDVPDGYGAMASVLWQKGDRSGAIAHAEKALSLAPNDAGFLAGTAYYQQKEMNVDQSIALFKQAILLNPKAQDWIYENYGEALVMAGQYEKAMVAYQVVLDRGRGGSVAVDCHLGMALAHDAQGNGDLASQAIQAALTLNPKLTLGYLRKVQTYSDQAYEEEWLADLGRLGIPE